MIRNRPIYIDGGYQIRSQDALISQIKGDYQECKERLEWVRNGITDISEIEKILQIAAWVKKGLEELKELKGIEIEGVNWGQMEKIGNEIASIQDQIRNIIKKKNKIQKV